MSLISSTTTPTPESVEFTATAIAALEHFRIAREAEKVAKENKARAEKILREVLAGAPAGTIAGQIVLRVVESSNSHIDKDALRSAFPEAYEATLVTTPYNYLKAL
jgi:hypothetical protein